MLLTPHDVLCPIFCFGQKTLMGRFYEMQRRRMNLLVDADGAPVGGRWSFDADNRKKLPKAIVVPDRPIQAETALVRDARRSLTDEGLGASVSQMVSPTP